MDKKTNRIIVAVVIVLIAASAVSSVLFFNAARKHIANRKDLESTEATASVSDTTASTKPKEQTSADPTDDNPVETIANANPTVDEESTTKNMTTGDFISGRRKNPETGRILVQVTDENYKLVVVNSTREFPADYKPELAQILGTDKTLDARVAPHYEEMYYAAKQDGIILTPFSAYRSYERQKTNYENRAATEHANGLSWEQAYAEAAKVILPPGTSEHNLGLCMDICNVYNSFETQPEFAWLQENAYKYGFILRYPKGKEDVTGIVYEPWHWRYVGVENAKQIRDSGLCLEEWLDANGIAY